MKINSQNIVQKLKYIYDQFYMIKFKNYFTINLFKSFLLLLFFNENQSIVSVSPDRVYSAREGITPITPEPDIYARPKVFSTSNNLRRKNSSPFVARGEYLSLEGYITDVLDIPIENVVVRIWQTNHMGYYNFLVEDVDDPSQYDIDFNPSGTSITNNLGYYNFTTIMPGYYGNRTPHIHFLLQHEYFGEIELEMFFPDHPRNMRDNKYRMLSKDKRKLTTCMLIPINKNNPSDGKSALFNIKLDFIHPHKRY